MIWERGNNNSGNITKTKFRNKLNREGHEESRKGRDSTV